MNSDQEKYGSVIKGLHSQKTLNNDQYPKNMIEGNNVLSTHRFDNVKEVKKDSRKNEKYERNNSHNKKEEDENDEPVVLSFAQLEGKCYCCGKAGHKSHRCYQKDKTLKDE